MANDNVQRLKDAGFNLDLLSPQQRQALTGLSNEEIKTLIAIQQRLGAAGASAQPETGGIIY